ncbi:efflux RND transporter periplasmic adaptor subunit [Chloroflexota bacterium]
MKLLKTMFLVLVLGGVSLLSLSCSAESDSTSLSEDQIVTVERGDITIDITAVGNLALSLTEDLAFEMEGTVEQVFVEAGDTVEEGQILAKLDTSEREDELGALEDKVTAAERNLTAAERQLTVKEQDLLQAEINLTNAEITLEETNTTYSLSDFRVAQADVDEAEKNLEDTLLKWDKYGEGTVGYGAFQEVVLQAQVRLDTAKTQLDAMSSGFDTREIAIKKLQVEIDRGKLEDARLAIEDARVAIADAEEALNDAREELADAKSVSPQIIASFDGFITVVNVKGGDEVKKGTVAMQLADPTKFEADVMIGEMDIFQVKLGGNAAVQVDAMPTINLPAKVTHISPTATIQSGVVNYKVKVELQSLEALMQEQQQARQGAMEKIEQGELPERLKQAIEEGSMTQEQAEEMMKQRQQGEGGQQAQVPTATLEDFQLMEGLTVTVSILVDESNDALLVPNGAITRQGTETLVQVLKDGVIELRPITTGISDWQYTEVTGGLTDGEQIIVSQGAAVTPATQSGQSQRGGTFIPGMGRIR